jgi:hypothetical protein
LRATYYSNSIDPLTRLVLGRDVSRAYGELRFDVRPPALARNFYRADNALLRFRHVIEPYLTYRKITGINNFPRIIRFDAIDAIADTNEIEYGLTNRFFTRRSTENVSGSAPGANGALDAGQLNGGNGRTTTPSSRPEEVLSLRFAANISSTLTSAARSFPAGATSSTPSIRSPVSPMAACPVASRPCMSKPAIARTRIYRQTCAPTSTCRAADCAISSPVSA